MTGEDTTREGWGYTDVVWNWSKSGGYVVGVVGMFGRFSDGRNTSTRFFSIGGSDNGRKLVSDTYKTIGDVGGLLSGYGVEGKIWTPSIRYHYLRYNSGQGGMSFGRSDYILRMYQSGIKHLIEQKKIIEQQIIVTGELVVGNYVGGIEYEFMAGGVVGIRESAADRDVNMESKGGRTGYAHIGGSEVVLEQVELLMKIRQEL